METSILQPDDFQIGMFITVQNLKDKPVKSNENISPVDMAGMMMMVPSSMAPPPSKNNSLELLKGTVIRIDAINLPYLMVTVFTNITTPDKKPTSTSVPIDVRELEFIKLNKKYVDVYLGETALPQLLQGKQFDNFQQLDDINELKHILHDITTKLHQEEERRRNEN